MTWSKKQIQAAGMAARFVDLSDEDRYNILRNIPGKHAIDGGVITSKAKRLTDADFELYMAIVENKSNEGQLPGWPGGHWQRKAADVFARMRRKVEAMARELEVRGLLKLGGMIQRMAGDDRGIDELDAHQLYQLLEALKAIARRHHVNLAA